MMTDSEPEYVKLISSDGFEFIIHREAAIRSGTIKNMLCGPGKLKHILFFKN
jgi:transcription elongation factor B subunit 1